MTVLYNSLVVKQIVESMHFALSQTSCVIVNLLQGEMVMKPVNINIIFMLERPPRSAVFCVLRFHLTKPKRFYWLLPQSVENNSCGMCTVKIN